MMQGDGKKKLNKEKWELKFRIHTLLVRGETWKFQNPKQSHKKKSLNTEKAV